ncbi:MAG: OmpA family protein [Bacteroidia bacterium]|nr:OmpA family protein [Bacteroidia bacterium]
MKKIIWMLVTPIVFFPFFTAAQNKEFNKENLPNKTELKTALKEIKEGDFYYYSGIYSGFAKALPHYINAGKLNPDNRELNKKTGKCYLNSCDKSKALPYLEKAKQLDNNSDLEIDLLLARAYHNTLQFDKTIAIYEEYINLKGAYDEKFDNKEIKKQIAECRYGKEMIANPVNVKIENLGGSVNTGYAEYCPIITADESSMIFTSRRDNTTGGGKDPAIDDYYEDLYITWQEDGVWTAPINMGKPVNTDSHDATVGLSPDGQELLIYKDDNGDGNIYRCELKGSEWSAPMKLNENINSKSQEPSACFSFDGKTLYFVSDRPGGYGGKDIYISHKDETGNWGQAKNLGGIINTGYDDDGVFMHPDGVTLYFSSVGHKTIGGYDIFMSRFENGIWSEPQNLGYPINSSDDDVFFVISASGKHGYYSSVKTQGFGNKDIYRVTFLQDTTVEMEVRTKEPKLTLLKGIVRDAKTEKPLEAEIEIIDNTGNETVAIFKSNSESGKYLVSLPSGKNYGISVQAKGYIFHSENFDIEEKEGYQEINKDIYLKKPEIGVNIILKNIFFDYGKAVLRNESVTELERLIDLLNKYPELKIEISGHTDSKGDNEFNLNLSQQRANAVVSYLIGHNISNSRLIAIGYGETHPVAPNESPDGTDNPEGRAMNRRTEFKITGK